MDTIWSSFQSRSGLCKSNMALFPGPCPAFHHEHERQKVGWRPWNKATTFMEWTPDQTPEKPKSWMDIMWRKGYEYVISKQTVVNGASMVGKHKALCHCWLIPQPSPSFTLLAALQPTDSLAGAQEQGCYYLCEWQFSTKVLQVRNFKEACSST